MLDEAAAFYWFNSRVISDTGEWAYGRFAYNHFLRVLAPVTQSNAKAWFVLCDGDCLVNSDFLRDYFRPQDCILLDSAERLGEALCYVIAVLGQGVKGMQEIDRDLQKNSVLGYMGMTSLDNFQRASFLECREKMALPIAVRIDGKRFKKISYGFHSDSELNRMGFEPYEAERA